MAGNVLFTFVLLVLMFGWRRSWLRWGILFIPATHIADFWAFLNGVCVIAAGLTFLETIANPYTIEFGATRMNLAQSCNGIGLLLGPIVGGIFFYSKDTTGESTGAE